MSVENFKDLYFGKRPLTRVDDLVRLVASKIKVDPSTQAKKLYLYKKPEEQSLLIRIGDKIAKVYDSKDLSRPVVNWVVDANKLVGQAIEVRQNKITFPNRKGKSYIFDEDLFANQDVQSAIQEDLA